MHCAAMLFIEKVELAKKRDDLKKKEIQETN